MRLEWSKLYHSKARRMVYGVSAASLALAIVLLTTYSVENRGDIRTARLESIGLAPTNALVKVIQLLQQHRGLSVSALAGNTTMEQQRAATQIQVDQAVEAVGAIVTSHIHDPMLAGAWRRVAAGWRVLAKNVSLRVISSRESLTSHTTLIEDSLSLLDNILDYFGLTLDPSADGSHLIMGALAHLPELTESLGQARARGTWYLSTTYITMRKRLVLTRLIATANEQHAQMAREFRKAMEVNPQVKAALSTPMENSATLMRRATHLAHTQIIDTQIPSYPPTDYFAEFTKVIDGQLTLLMAAQEELGRILGRRMTELRRQQTQPLLARIIRSFGEPMKIIGFVGVVIACVVWLRVAFTRQTRHVARLLAIANEPLVSGVSDRTSPQEIAVQTEVRGVLAGKGASGPNGGPRRSSVVGSHLTTDH